MMKIGVVGVPPQEILNGYTDRGNTFIDLDEPISDIPISVSESCLPRVFCAILRTIAANAISLDLDLLIAGVGECKCDGMRYVASILKDIVRYPIIETRNMEMERRGNPISTSSLPLIRKVELITSSVIRDISCDEEMSIFYAEPVAGYWGVPPYNFSILELFPDYTHVYGWTRCMENKTPADLQLEMEVDDNMPIVFYAQTFCQKNGLARYLASRYNGLYVEVDERMNSSTRSKIEAFLEFRVKEYDSIRCGNKLF
ncbi:MAG: hypothetical protein ACE5EA_02230 [Nitrospirota bacterium]